MSLSEMPSQHGLPPMSLPMRLAGGMRKAGRPLNVPREVPPFANAMAEIRPPVPPARMAFPQIVPPPAPTQRRGPPR